MIHYKLLSTQVIASLKRALQPSVTDLEVDFQLTSSFEAFQAPAKIPTILIEIGEGTSKVMEYDIGTSRI